AELIAPAGSAMAESNPDDSQHRLLDADRLTVRWPRAEMIDAAASLEADQLLWWNIRPQSVVLEGRFRLWPVGGKLRELTITVDPRLRLLPAAHGSGVGHVTVEEGTVN